MNNIQLFKRFLREQGISFNTYESNFSLYRNNHIPLDEFFAKTHKCDYLASAFSWTRTPQRYNFWSVLNRDWHFYRYKALKLNKNIKIL